jgi:hypothetical protein
MERKSQQLLAPLAICSQLQLESSVVRLGAVYLKQYLFMYETYVKYGSASNCRQKFRLKFRDEGVPSRQTIHNLVNKLRRTINKKQNYKRRILTEKLVDIGARLENAPRKTLKYLAQVTGVSKSSARTATQLLKLRPYETTINSTGPAAARCG